MSCLLPFALICTRKLVEAISTCQAFPRFHHSLNLVEPKRFIIVWEFLAWVNGWGVSEVILEPWPLIPVGIIRKLMKPHSITVRLGPDLKQRLHQSALKLDLSENDIAKHAVRAAVDFIESNDYRIELPLQMAAANGPVESTVRRPEKKLRGG